MTSSRQHFGKAQLLLVCCAALFSARLVQAAPLAKRITDGAPYEEGEFGNSTVLIDVIDEDTGVKYICHGIIISSKHVLTAASCFDREVLSVAVSAGVYNARDDRFYDFFEKAKVKIHPFYTDFSDGGDVTERSRNNIAVVEIREEFNFDKRTVPVSLTTLVESVPPPGTVATMTGWGGTKARDRDSGPLPEKADVTTLADRECENLWLASGEDRPEPRPGRGTLCVVDEPGSSVLCNDDEGSPLYVGNQIVAIANYGPDKCKNTAPNVYTLIAPYICWLEFLRIPDIKSEFGPCNPSPIAPFVNVVSTDSPSSTPVTSDGEDKSGGDEEDDGDGGSDGGSDGGGSGGGDVVSPTTNTTNPGPSVSPEDPEESLVTQAPPSSAAPREPAGQDVSEDTGSCFPGSSVVSLEDGTTRTVADLSIGDRVLVSNGAFSEIFFFSHRKDTGTYAFLHITTIDGFSVKVSPSHYLPVGDVLRAAEEITTGDFLTLANGDRSRVVGVDQVYEDGLYSPHTGTGDIVVSGVLASCYTKAVHPMLASVLLSPLKYLYRLGVQTSGFLDQDAPRLLISALRVK